ncbi:YceI family protein [Novosphingobium piscinae]|uniref:YceI family protein n=2 Tax=Novosphingobium piscinae TaxID=1507448 RepID=A0A7X1FW01_9SPHN|nr:YceI family protein [Novosphingobium piscinae]MBC2668014.1 YceI family protein [Novosphingobium piscinae]
MTLLGATSPAQTYRLDETRSTVAARVAFFGIASKTARFPRLSGSIALSPDRLDTLDLIVELDARALTAPDPVTLERLRGPAFFDVARYPQVRFAGRRMTMTSPVTATVEGELTARGVTQPVALTVSFAQPPARATGTEPIRLSARATINRTAFGMTAWPLIVGRTVTITIDGWLVPA